MTKKTFFIKLILWIIFTVLFIGATYGSFFIWKINKMENKIKINQNNNISLLDTAKSLALSDRQINLKQSQKNRINILLLGIAGTNKPGQNLTDTLMIVSINTKTNQLAMLSIPRDLYVDIPDANFKSKINSVYQYGLEQSPDDIGKAIEPIEKTIKNITSLDIDYWAVMNFDGFRQVVDSIGGINITNKRDIYDSHYPGPNYSYETFQLKKGFHHLDGATALKYARMRHDDPEGDFGRAKRQQQVLQAIKNKLFSTGTLLNALTINKLFDALGNNLKTNIKLSEFDDFLKLSRKLDTNNITNVVIDAWNDNSLLIVSHVFYKNMRAFVLVPRVGNWSETRELAQNIFSVNKIKKERQEISQENASIVIINKSGKQNIMTRIDNLLKNNFGYKNVSIISDRNRDLEEKTVIYDLTDGANPFTLDELVKKLSAQASYNLGDNYKKLMTNIKADLVVVIGKDLINRYNMKQDSFEEYNQANK